jgi:hypothetical protein
MVLCGSFKCIKTAKLNYKNILNTLWYYIYDIDIQMDNQDDLSMVPTFEPTGAPTISSNPSYAPTQMTLHTSNSGDASRFVIMITIIFIVICVLYTYCRSKITSRIGVE